MTLRTARKMINETRILVTTNDDNYIILDYLGDSNEFRKALHKVEELLSRKVKWINYNKATQCIQIDCE